jgi:predicted nuclease of predicted toxin-antitoxin system
MKLLANENCPRLVVDALSAAGHDVLWIRTAAPGLSDPDVLARAVAEARVLVTFDKDFGELAFRVGLAATCGVILLRIGLADPVVAASRLVGILGSRSDWPGHFSVVTDHRIRMRSILSPGTP